MSKTLDLIKRFMVSVSESGGEFTFYLDDDNNAVTEFYYGTKSSTSVPLKLKGHTVVKLGCTTFCSNETIQSVKCVNKVSEIE